MKFIYIFNWLIIIVVLLFSSSCYKTPTAPLRVGLSIWPGYEFIFLAQEKDLFSKKGVPVQLIEFPSLGDTRLAFERGQLDMMAITLSEVLLAQQQLHYCPQIIYVLDYSNGGDVILAQPSLTKMTQLRGKRVGLELGSVNLYLLARALEKSGLTLDDVSLVPMPPAAMKYAFPNHEVDAVVTYPPLAFTLQESSQARLLFSSQEIPKEIIDVLVVQPQILTNRFAEIVQFLQVFEQAVQSSLDHPQEAYQIMAEREGMTPNAFQEILTQQIQILHLAEQQPFFEPNGILERTLQITADLLHKTEYLTSSPQILNCVMSEPVLQAAQ